MLLEGEGLQEPRDAFLSVDVPPGTHADAEVLQFANELTHMYMKWVESRQMRFKILIESRVDPEGMQRFVLAVAGFGAYSILKNETGIHVWEDFPEETGNRKKINAYVRVAPQPIPASKDTSELIAQAEQQFSLLDGRTTIVRRYRRLPSPLVRDRIKAWRTGNIDLVLKGNFDLMG